MNEVTRGAVEVLATPLTAALLLCVVGLIAWVRQRRRFAGALWIGAGLLVYIAALVPVGAALLRPLERYYAPPRSPLPDLRYIVVLGSSYTPRPDLSVVSAQEREGLVRIIEGVRLLRLLPGAQLVVSGGARPGDVPGALGYAELARQLGVEPGALIVLDQPRNTAAEARALAVRLGAQPFLLITSAWHMPRAMRLMERAGAHAVPLPTGQESEFSCRPWWACTLPSSRALGMTDRALHEYLGLAAVALNLQ